MPKTDDGLEKDGDTQVSPNPSGDGQDPSNQDSPTVEELTLKMKELTDTVDDIKTTAQTDLSRQKSALQSTHAAEMRDLQSGNQEQIAALEVQIRQATLTSLDEGDREAYERSWATEDKRKLEDQIETLQSERDMALNMGQYVQAANTLGIDPSKIDVSNPEAAYQSMWTGVTELISELKANNEELQKNAAKPTPKDEDKTVTKDPEKVLTTQHSTPQGTATIYDVRKALSDELGRPVSLNEVFNMAEERPDLEQKLRELTPEQK